MTRDRERLQDMLEAIERVQRYSARGRNVFEEDELVQTWVVHNLQILGQAARNVSDSFRSSHPEVPWTLVIGMRNVLVHGYHSVDLAVVWSTVERDLPELRQQIGAIIETFDKAE